VKTLEALVLSVMRRLHSILAKGGLGEIRLKLAPAIASAVLNMKRRELAEMEEESGAKILIQADWAMAYGEMTAELERAEEVVLEKPTSKPHREKTPEDETVVLGGDSPISFDKALGEDKPHRDKGPVKEAFKYDRRDVQRAALDERERLRALFESAKPEDEEEAEGPDGAASGEDDSKGDGPKRKRRRRRRKGGAERSGETPVSAEASQPGMAESESQLEPPRFTADLAASLLTPSHRPRLGAGPVPEEAPKPKRTPRAKVTSVDVAPVPAPVPPPPIALPETPKPKRSAPKAKPTSVKAPETVKTTPDSKPIKPRKPLKEKGTKTEDAPAATPGSAAPKAKRGRPRKIKAE
jgi:ribonuclease E